jgi:hypothetical protein
LVPKYFRPNDTLPNVEISPCTVQELFGLLSHEQDGCEGGERSWWLHFVVTGNVGMVELMIKNGADLFGDPEFVGCRDAALQRYGCGRRQKDRMANLLRACAPGESS